MKTDEVKEYAEMLIDMSADYLIEKCDEHLYLSMLSVMNKKLEKYRNSRK